MCTTETMVLTDIEDDKKNAKKEKKGKERYRFLKTKDGSGEPNPPRGSTTLNDDDGDQKKKTSSCCNVM